jgi:hypothetical protein
MLRRYSRSSPGTLRTEFSIAPLTHLSSDRAGSNENSAVQKIHFILSPTKIVCGKVAARERPERAKSNEPTTFFGARLAATLFSKRTAYRMTRPALRRINDEDSDGLVALPPVAVVRQRLRTTVKEFAHAAPGRRAAALAAVWIAATGCEADLSVYDGEDALRTYRLAESELRAELRLTMARAINNEPHPDTRESMVHMLERLEELEQAAVAPKPQRRRRRR